MKNVHPLWIAVLLLVGALAACAEDRGGELSESRPSVGFANLADGAEVLPDHVVRVNVSAAAGLRDVLIRIDGGTATELEPRAEIAFALPDLAEGAHTLEVVATDVQGRVAVAARTFTVSATADPGTEPGTDPGTGDPPSDGSDEPGAGGLAVEWVAPGSTRPVAGDVALEVRAPAGSDVEIRYQASAGDPQPIARGVGPTVEATWNTLMLQPGTYTLIAEATGADGARGTSSIEVEVQSPLVITNPEADDAIGPEEDRQQVDVTVGLTGTLRDGTEVESIEVLIGSLADGREALLARDTEGGAVFVYSWDTCEPSAGHDPTILGDRTIHVLVTFASGATLLSDGVEVAYMGGCL